MNDNHKLVLLALGLRNLSNEIRATGGVGWSNALDDAASQIEEAAQPASDDGRGEFELTALGKAQLDPEPGAHDARERWTINREWVNGVRIK